MTRTGTVVIGGGQAGLAMSACLAGHGIDHVVLERGRLAERWRSERWDSLRLLTPNWLSRLPGFRYTGPDPDGYMTMPEVVAFFERYAAVQRAPLRTGTDVVSLRHDGREFHVQTTQGAWAAPTVVVATGYCDRPFVPAMADRLPAGVAQFTTPAYRRPSQLPEGGVLVVGASATGVQLADEIQASGRPVTLAVGRHTRLPRTYRGRDILWWLDRAGLFDERIDEVADPVASTRQPSLQLVGRPDHASLGLGELTRRGVRIVGRLLDVDGDGLTLDPDLVAVTAAADVKLATLLARLDAVAARQGLVAPPPEAIAPVWPQFAADPPPARLSFAASGIRSVIWATGFRREYPWMALPVLDARGDIRHRGGITDVPGLVVMGMRFQRRRKSAFIDGVGDDARDLSAHLVGVLDGRAHSAA
jgi:putative flavoprotein involved in K+ transport